MRVVRALAGPLFVVAGTLHFTHTRWYVSIVPDYLPAHRELVYASGVAEIAGGAGLMVPATRRAGGWWLIATLVAVFPANVWMARSIPSATRCPVGARRFTRGCPCRGSSSRW